MKSLKLELVLIKNQCTVVDGTLYYVEKKISESDPFLDLPEETDDVHSGKFVGHLRDVKIHSLLSKHYWWPRMRKDICS